MAYVPYLTYEKYLEVGGKNTDYAISNFSTLERKTHRFVDYITYNRIPKLPEIPEEVFELQAQLIDNEVEFSLQAEGNDLIDSYSNGVEKLTYKRKTRREIEKESRGLAYQYLPDYLLARSVNFDVEEYLQSNNNDSE